jgi:hypothetical protein
MKRGRHRRESDVLWLVDRDASRHASTHGTEPLLMPISDRQRRRDIELRVFGGHCASWPKARGRMGRTPHLAAERNTSSKTVEFLA